MADCTKKFVYRQFFENKLLKSTGDAFQQLVYDLLSEIYPNFERIDVQGSYGDRKNDGYIRGEGIFYQVYGPKDVASNYTSLTTAEKKMPGDFNELKEQVDQGYWEDINAYNFVFKVQRGTYPSTQETLKTMKSQNPNVTFNIIDINDLLRLFTSLNIEQMSFVSNTYISEPDFEMVSYEAMREIINHLITDSISENVDFTKQPPDFESKITFNKISAFQALHLRTASYFIEKLDDYLNSYSDLNMADLLCSIFKSLYKKAVELYPNDSTIQFKYILDSCHKSDIPKNQIQTIETNSYIMMAKYFETCDIFLEPPK